MTLPQYAELAAYWRKFPPIHLLLGKLLGYNPEEQRTNSLSDLFAQFGPGGKIGGE
jgi:hypothetical protein